MYLRLITVLAGLLLVASIAYAAPPTTMNYQGVLRDDLGAPLTGSVPVHFRLFDDELAGLEVWEEGGSVEAVGGVFETVLGVTNPLEPSLFDAGPLWLQLEVDNEVLSPRQRLTSVPWALRAAQSDLADLATTATTATHATTADSATTADTATLAASATALVDPTPVGALVPVGGIIDWYAFDVAAVLPEGFEVCDGLPVEDVDSPFFGVNKPDLIDRFALGVATPAETGTTGGANSSDLGHEHGTGSHAHALASHQHTAPNHGHTMAHSHAGPGHAHNLSSHSHGMSHTHGGPSHAHSSAHTHGTAAHRHKTAFYNTSENYWTVRDVNDDAANLRVNNVSNSDGSGMTALARGNASDDFQAYTWTGAPLTTNSVSTTSTGSTSGTTGGSSSGSTGGPSNNSSGSSGTANTGGSSAGSTGSAGATATSASSGNTQDASAGTTATAGPSAHDNRPAYVGLLKLIRVR